MSHTFFRQTARIRNRSRLALAALLAPLLIVSTRLPADPLSKQMEIDFYRDTTSRSLKGLATRSDGRIVAGPQFTDLTGPPLADLLWALTSAGKGRWWLGTGPEGRVLEITFNPENPLYSSRELVRLNDSNVFAVLRLPDGGLLAGTSPRGTVQLVRDGRVTAGISLPVDSIFDLKLQDSGTVVAATGNPGRIYRINLRKFASGGVTTEKITDERILAERGVTLLGAVRDRNLRKLALLENGDILAGSAPRGNLYSFSHDGGPPRILLENRDAEVSDILVASGGDIYAALVFSGSGNAPSRINRPPPSPVSATEKETASGPPSSPDSPQERFTGRSSVVWIPRGGGFPETILSRSGVAIYQLGLREETLLVAGGEHGDFAGYDLRQRRSLTFPGSISSQISGLAAIDSHRLLAVRNNAPGLALIDFEAAGSRELETKRLDVGIPARLGALRFNRLRDVSDAAVNLSLRANFGSDEIEGWGPWEKLPENDGGWQASSAVRGRYVQLRLKLPAETPSSMEIDKAALYFLPQNRRPTLTDFRLFAANFALLPAPEPAPQASITLGQIISRGKDAPEEKRRNSLLSSAVVPSPGMQIAYWTLNDPDGDKLAATFSLRKDGDARWTDVAVQIDASYAQFDTSHLPDGTYFTRLVVSEESPRPPAERLTTTFETDDLVIDRTPPEFVRAVATRKDDNLVVTVQGRDNLSLLEGVEFRFNNGLVETVEQPADGIRDGREETFILETPLSRLAPSTNVEVVIYDSAGNSSARRLTW
ncbi:MAG: hypothetical protein HS122_13005 [Opitutaceae bacterium]|nr:hypothetical protein [Opitutaceae bacterium]